MRSTTSRLSSASPAWRQGEAGDWRSRLRGFRRTPEETPPTEPEGFAGGARCRPREELPRLRGVASAAEGDRGDGCGRRGRARTPQQHCPTLLTGPVMVRNVSQRVSSGGRGGRFGGAKGTRPLTLDGGEWTRPEGAPQGRQLVRERITGESRTLINRPAAGREKERRFSLTQVGTSEMMRKLPADARKMVRLPDWGANSPSPAPQPPALFNGPFFRPPCAGRDAL